LGNDGVDWVDDLGTEVWGQGVETRVYPTRVWDRKKKHLLEDAQKVRLNYRLSYNSAKCIVYVIVPVKFSAIKTRGFPLDADQWLRKKESLTETSKMPKRNLEAMIKGINNAAERAWNGKFRLCCEGCRKECKDGVKIKVGIVLDDEFGLQIGITDIGKERYGDETNWNVGDFDQVAHELGHHIGNPDEYSRLVNLPEGKKTSDGKWDEKGFHDYEKEDPDSIMVTEKGVAHIRHFDTLRQKTGCKLTAETVPCDWEEK
jgi:hypothetical protein